MALDEPWAMTPPRLNAFSLDEAADNVALPRIPAYRGGMRWKRVGRCQMRGQNGAWVSHIDIAFGNEHVPIRPWSGIRA